MSAFLNFERAKFGVLCVETAAARKEVPTSLLEEAWASLEVTKTVPEESLVEVKAVFEELYSNYFAKEDTPTQGNQIYVWDSWNLLVGWDKILKQVKAKANCEIEALRAREEKSVDIMACWRDDNKVLSHKISSLETKLFEAFSKEGNGNKSQGQDNSRMDWLDLDPPQQAAAAPGQDGCLEAGGRRQAARRLAVGRAACRQLAASRAARGWGIKPV
ncbi:hypothetical protein DSO57_1011690 [Entomophthora muscae]|uniref:Uncharacterized protein n=1 Tax=Entomophthora muscae TaxID=34485 RepID=A0ACC2TUA1_9FUNG|nr:hypothetical protein DSO57_1011690 [Entomophthora muscae]